MVVVVVGVWVIGYGSWVMGYGLWVMGGMGVGLGFQEIHGSGYGIWFPLLVQRLLFLLF